MHIICKPSTSISAQYSSRAKCRSLRSAAGRTHERISGFAETKSNEDKPKATTSALNWCNTMATANFESQASVVDLSRASLVCSSIVVAQHCSAMPISVRLIVEQSLLAHFMCKHFNDLHAPYLLIQFSHVENILYEPCIGVNGVVLFGSHIVNSNLYLFGCHSRTNEFMYRCVRMCFIIWSNMLIAQQTQCLQAVAKRWARSNSYARARLSPPLSLPLSSERAPDTRSL